SIPSKEDFKKDEVISSSVLDTPRFMASTDARYVCALSESHFTNQSSLCALNSPTSTNELNGTQCGTVEENSLLNSISSFFPWYTKKLNHLIMPTDRSGDGSTPASVSP